MSDPQACEAPPDSDALTDYDRSHIKLYIRLLDAEAAGASWDRAAAILLNIDPLREPERARRMHDAHLVRAHWMTRTGYRYLLN